MRMKKNEKQWIKILDNAGIGIEKPFTMKEGIAIIKNTPQVRSTKDRAAPHIMKLRSALLKSDIFEQKERYCENRNETKWVRVFE